MNKKYAIVLGKGDLGAKVVADAKLQGLDFIIVGIKGFSPRCLVNSHPNFWFYLGQLEVFFSELKTYGCTHIVFAGQITRPSFWALKLDATGKQVVKDYLSKAKGDNNLLSLIIQLIEERGYTVTAPQNISSDLLVNKTIFTSLDISNIQKDIEDGYNMAKKLGNLDIGQSIICQQGMVITVEAVEGTAEMILRSKKLLKKTGPKGILIKIKKDNQTSLIDLPTIGLQTLKQAKKVGLAGIVIEAGGTIFLNKEESISFANKNNMFIVAV